MTDFVQCSCCGGEGHVPLDGVFADTLKVLRKQRGEVTGAELSRAMKCKPTAMNNRLSYLQRHGFAVSRKYGRRRFYRAT